MNLEQSLISHVLVCLENDSGVAPMVKHCNNVVYFVLSQLLVCEECALCICFAIDQVQNCNRLIQLLA